MQIKSKKLNEILIFFNRHKIEYVLVGEKIDDLLFDINGDVDIVVSKSSFINLHHIIDKLCNELHISLIQLYRHEIDVFGTLFAWYEDGKYFELGLDICVDYRRKGYILIQAEKLLQNKMKDESTQWFSPSFENNFFYYLIKKIGKHSINNTQISFLYDLYNQSNKEIIKSLISKYWDSNDQKQIIEIIQNKDVNAFISQSKIYNQTMTSKLKRSLKEYFINIKRKISYIFEPRGLICSLKENDLLFFEEYIKTTSKWFRKNKIIKYNQFSPLNLLRILNLKWHSGIVFVVNKKTNQCFFSDIKLNANKFQSLKEHYTEIINFMKNREIKRLQRFSKSL